MAGNKVGRLWVSVDANIKPAIASLRTLDKQVNVVKANINSIGRGVGGTDKLTQSLKHTSSEAQKTGESLRRVGLKAQSAQRPMTALQATTYRLSQAFVNLRYGNPLGVFAGLGQAASSAGSAIAGLAKGGLPGLAAAAAITAVAIETAAFTMTAALAKFGLESAANLEMLQIQFEGLLGSASRAQAEMDFVTQLATESIVPTDQLLEANRLLLAYGVTADDTRRSLLSFMSDFGTATGISTGKLQDMAYALGQIQSQGKANQIDLRQLANAGLNLSAVYKSVAQSQGISVAEAKKLTSEGKMTADVIIPAITAMGSKYDEAAKKARNSVQGILANLKDIANIKLGNAFRDLLTNLKPALKFVEDVLQKLDFRWLTAAFSNFVSYVREGLQGMSGNAQETANWFVNIAQAINLVGYQIGVTISGIRMLVSSLHLVVNFLWQLITGTIESFGQLMLGISNVVSMIPGMGDQARAAAEGAGKMIAWAGEQANSAAAQVSASAADIAANWNTVEYKTLAIRFDFAQKTTDFFSNGIKGVKNTYTPPKLPTPPTSPAGGGSGGSKTDKELEKWKKWIKSLKEILKDFRAAIAELNGLNTSAFGQLTDIQKAFKFDGADGNFQASIDSIVGMYDTLTKSVQNYYAAFQNANKFGAAVANKAKADMKASLATLKANVSELVRLASENERLQKALDKWREGEISRVEGQIAELDRQYNGYRDSSGKYIQGKIEQAQSALDEATAAYEKANDKLQTLIDKRDEFLQNVSDNALSFVNALETSSETITQYTRLDAAGSFIETQTQQNKSFKDSLRERLDTLKSWAANIKALTERGLDPALLQNLVSAGPEASGAILQELVNGSQDSLNAINQIQAETNGVIESLTAGASAAWFDAEINTATTTANTLKDAENKAKDALTKTEEVYYAQLQSYQSYLDSVQAGTDAYTLSQQALMQSNADSAAAIVATISASVAALTDPNSDKNLAMLGKQGVAGLIQGLEDMKPLLKQKVEEVADIIRRTLRKALNINSPSKVTMEIGQNLGAGLAMGMDSSLAQVEKASLRMAGASLPDVGGGNSAAPVVKVFIGDMELRDIIDVQVEQADARAGNFVMTGRRL